ncbi:MAG: hypothetical protein IH850_08495 [Acidobacteria bacterium]|nr:hypothetical protein [Acidobacteriota bacterium]
MTAEGELQQWANLVVYERQQMIHACRRLWELDQERHQAELATEGSEEQQEWQRRLPEWQIDSNAFLESYCIHYRNLQDFLSPRDSVQKRDVTAGPFLGEEHDFRLINPDSPALQYRDAIDKRLTHISKDRTTVQADEKQWYFLRMYEEMDQAWWAFLAELEATGHDDRAQWFQQSGSSPVRPSAGAQIEWSLSPTVAASTQSTFLSEITTFSDSPTPDWVLPRPATRDAVTEDDQGD